ncbi:hypothetical protein BTA51_14290 [Hahella sp. CCB-MM4]|nr:hypothetical protein BTA51_14290 [Hahella sp. CCB-MM4]
MLSENVLDLFRRVLNSDPVTIKRVHDFNGDVHVMDTEVCLVFSLKGLYKFIGASESGSYAGFRKGLYQSDLNQQLQDAGAVIEIFQSTGKIESNLYCLKRLQDT